MKSSPCLAVLSVLVVLGFVVAPLTAQENEEKEQAEDKWLQRYDKALEQAEETGKPVLVNFTGSDWCGFCIRQEDEVFSTDEFKAWAEENVVLLELDFPRSKEQSDELKQQNRELQRKYEVRGFPTVLVLNAEGEAIERYVGYRPGMGAEKWIERTQEAVDKAKAEAEEEEAA